ncbi:MAG TPA: NAD(P)H-binding protein [Polyangia bacterium]
MKVILFGATGMVGQGVLRECLRDPRVTAVLAIGRSPGEATDAKLRQLVHRDFTNFSSLEGELAGYDACFFCLGVSSVGMSEADYRHVTFDFTLAAARTLVKANPEMTFIYVSGTGTDSSAKGRSMWARVKGETENALLALPFKGAYMFRPGVIRPMHGVKSKTRLYRAAYVVATPLFPILNLLARGSVITTEDVGRAMIEAAANGAPKPLLENRDIKELAAKAA